MKRILFTAALSAVAAGAIAAGAAFAQHRQHGAHATPAGADARQAVDFPADLREHMLSNMRDHLAVLQEIQEALARGAADRAADVAERRLGMSSLTLHGAQEAAKFMPQGMQDAGTGMHRAASRFAIAAQDAGVTGDVRAALGALSEVTAQCVGCHAGYKVR